MNRKTSDVVVSSAPRISGLDVLKWIIAVTLFAVGFWANYYYAEVDWALRVAGWIVLGGVILGIVSQTNVGQKTWTLIKEARGELQKVFWPTRQETIQITMVVVGMVMLMALILWGIDSFLLWVVAGLTGRG